MIAMQSQLSRMGSRLEAVRVREATEARRIADTRAEVAALVERIAQLGVEDGPVADWNSSHPMGTRVRWSGSETTTRSSAWTADDGQVLVLVLVVGASLPVALESVSALGVISSPGC